MRKILILLAVLTLLAGLPAAADQAYDEYDDYEGETADDYALGLGLGLVDPDGDVEPYYSIGFRFRLGDHDRDELELRQGGIQGFLEPEIGYWEGDGASDLLVGVNLLGLVPFRNVDYYFGVGAGIHFLDADVELRNGEVVEGSDERLGVNAQFGLDVHVADNAALFGTGRFDLVEGSDNEIQEKIFLGVRFSW